MDPSEMVFSFFLVTHMSQNIYGVYYWEDYLEETTTYGYDLEGSTSFEDLPLDCFGKCLQKEECLITGYKQEPSGRISCEMLIQENPVMELKCHPTSGSNILTDSNMKYFHKVHSRKNKKAPYDCSDLLLTGHSKSGVYTVYPDWGDSQGIEVFCDMETDGGGWMVFQKRFNGQQDFNKNWEETKHGFGDLRKEFWLGNEIVHKFTSDKSYTLRIDLSDWENNTMAMGYYNFKIGNETDCYRLDATRGYGETNSQLVNGHCFSTYDRDNDTHIKSCAQMYKGPFWYSNCFTTALNGIYQRTVPSPYAIGIIAMTWKGFDYSLKTSEMKIRLKKC